MRNITRKNLLTILFAAIVTTAFAQSASKSHKDYTVSHSATKGERSLSFAIDTFCVNAVTINGVKYSTIEFNHGVNTNKKGFAELPMLSATLQLNDQNDIQVEVEEGDYIDVKLENPLLPSRGTIYRQQDPKSIPYIIAPESRVNAWYPESIAESTEPFIFRDTRGVNVYAYPFRYNAVTNTLRVYRNFKVIVKDDKSKSTNPLLNKPTYIDRAVDGVYKSLYINYSAAKFSNQIAEFGEMLVIYTSRDASAIQPYIDWKRQKGFKVNTLQVATGTNVKSNIQSAYSSNPNLLYVQLVGDWADIKSDLGTSSSAPTDPYMGCVAGSDYYPELIIGRFSANSAAQVTVQVNKAINYEKNPDMSGTWYKKALGIASGEGSGSGDDGEADYTHMDYIKNNKLLEYTYTNVASQYQSSATASGVASSVNSGVSLINYCGHGSETTFVTSGYSNTNINASTNGNMLPIIFSVACVNGKFHRTTGDCFAEAWLKKENGGAVATIMSTINQPWQPPMRGQDYFNDILIGGYNYTSNPGDGTNTTASDQRTTFGSITFNGNVLMLAEQYSNTDTRETFQTWTIFGDASLQVRTNTPKAITVSAGDVTSSTYSVTVTSNGTAVANARVALYQNGVSYSALTNSSGVASVNHNFTSGTAIVTVTACNYGTYQATVNVGASPTIPTTPSGLSTSGITTSGAKLAWSAASGATSYDVQIRPQGGAYATYNVASTSYSVTGLASNSTYEWSVRAKNSYGSSSYSATQTFTTQGIEGGLPLPVSENFTTSSIPANWTTQNTGTSITERWSVSNTANAGGAAYEMKCTYQNVPSGTSRFITPAINTVGVNQVTFSFRHMLDAYGSGATLRVQTSNDKSTWTNTDWSVATGSSNISAATVNVTVTTNLNSATTYFALVIDGNLYQIDYWYVDNISITGSTSAIDLPTVTTASISGITSSGAASGGNVTADGGATVTARGICYSTYTNPTIANSKVVSGSGTGSFVANVPGLEENTTYYVRAYATNSAGTAYGSQVSFTTLSGSVSYCTSKGSNVSYEWIDLVQFAGIDNTSLSDGGYKDNTSMVGSVALGGSYTIYMSAGFKSTAYTEYWAVWIDYNQDGIFATDEQVVSGSSSSSETLSASVTIPTTAITGSTRMRVSMKYNAAQTACETFSYGEVEDYTVSIADRRADDTYPTIMAQKLGNETNDIVTIFPNPVCDRLTIQLNGVEGAIPMKIYDVQGRVVKTQTITTLSSDIEVGDLGKGIYIISIEDEKEPINKRFVKY